MSDEWQPISTAPRDGKTSILVCNARTLDGFHQVVFWENAAQPQCPHNHWSTSDGIVYHEGLFTHWMHLPPPPGAAK